MKILPRVPGDRQLMDTGCKYRSKKIPGFIATEGFGSTEPGVPYLSSYRGNYSNVYIHHVLCTDVIGGYFSDCNAIENHNRMQQSDLALTKSGYFRIAIKVALGMGIKYGKLLFCHGISEEIKDKKISMGEYSDRTVYDCSNKPFLVYDGSPALHIPPITIDDSP